MTLDDQRLRTMAKRIAVDFPEFIELVAPVDKHNGLYRRIRHIQAKGDCCGVEMTKAELRAALKLANRDTVKDKAKYLCVMLDKFHIEKTLNIIRQNQDIATNPQVHTIVKYLAINSIWHVRVIAGLIGRKYSMADVVAMCELAKTKEKPARYLIGILKKGYTPYSRDKMTA